MLADGILQGMTAIEKLLACLLGGFEN
jgi:hypothetical protein